MKWMKFPQWNWMEKQKSICCIFGATTISQSTPTLKLWTILESESCDDVFWKSLRYEKGAEVVVIQFIALVATFGKVQPWWKRIQQFGKNSRDFYRAMFKASKTILSVWLLTRVLLWFHFFRRLAHNQISSLPPHVFDGAIRLKLL